MESWNRLTTESSTLIERTGIPRRVLLRLLHSTGIAVGSAVLDVGCGCGELVQFLDSLGIQCAGTDESPLNVSAARRNAPNCEIHCAPIDKPLPGLRTEFDLVVVREASEFRNSMLSRSTFQATVQLLTHVRPGGCLAFLAPFAGDRSSAHRIACYGRHVASLSADHELHEIPDGTVFTHPVRSLVTGRSRTGWGIALLRLPQARPSRLNLMAAVESALKVEQAPCCPWGGQLGQATAARSKAA